jgi:hypothetical protein
MGLTVCFQPQTKSGYKTRPKWKINKAVVHARPRNQGKRRRGYN